MKNNQLTDSELNRFFKQKKQTPKSDPLFTHKVMRQLPPHTPIKFLSPIIIVTAAAAILVIFGLNFNIFIREIGILLVDHHIHSEQILTLFITLISTFAFLIQQAVRCFDE